MRRFFALFLETDPSSHSSFRLIVRACVCVCLLYSFGRISLTDKSISSHSDARNRFSGEINLIEQRHTANCARHRVSVPLRCNIHIHTCALCQGVYTVVSTELKDYSARQTNEVAVPVSRQTNQQNYIHLGVRAFLARYKSREEDATIFPFSRHWHNLETSEKCSNIFS